MRLRPAKAAEYLGVTQRALERWRINGGGPRYAKLSRHFVVYDTADLDAFLEERKVGSTSEPPAARRPRRGAA